MKKKIACMIVIVLIIANLFLTPTTVPNKPSQFSLMLLEARADDNDGETNPPDPKDVYPPLRAFPTNWTLSSITDYFF